MQQLFEYGVILNGSQTFRRSGRLFGRFEYGVILNGSQYGTVACACHRQVAAR